MPGAGRSSDESRKRDVQPTDPGRAALSNRKRRTPKVAELIAQDIRREIILNRLTPGSILPSEVELTKEFGVGRASVREALRLLEYDGLITIRRGKVGGILVAQPDATALTSSLALLLTLSDAPISELFVVRRLLEPAAAQLAAETGTSEQIAHIQATVRGDLEKRAFDGPGNMGHFHGLLGTATNNRLLRILLDALEDIVRTNLSTTDVSSSDLRDIASAHAEVAEAVAARDGVRARLAMEKHLSDLETVLTEHGDTNRPIIPRSSWFQ